MRMSTQGTSIQYTDKSEIIELPAILQPSIVQKHHQNHTKTMNLGMNALCSVHKHVPLAGFNATAGIVIQSVNNYAKTDVMP